MLAADVDRAVQMFATQAKYCSAAVTPTYAAILQGMIDDVRDGGPICKILAHWDGALESAFALRVLGGLHRLVLDGKAPALAAAFPTTGGTAAPERVWPIARDVLSDHSDFIVAYTSRPPQTNEVARSAVLLGGFLTIAAHFPYPLRLRELGASAGLNLMWDQYAVETPSFRWGTEKSALTIGTQWDGQPPPLTAPVSIIDRAACDRDPIDIREHEGRVRLESYVWADQLERMERLRKACTAALEIPFRLEKADAADWIESELQNLPTGQTTVVYHSIFQSYLSLDTDAKLKAVMDAAGRRARLDAPLAWLAMEMADMHTPPALTLTLWPEGRTHTLASAHPHGAWVQWSGLET